MRSPPSSSRATREQVVQNHDFSAEFYSSFHILDSLPDNSLGRKEAKVLQNILLQLFKGENFVQGRIKINVPPVIPLFLKSTSGLSSNE